MHIPIYNLIVLVLTINYIKYNYNIVRFIQRKSINIYIAKHTKTRKL